MRNSLLGMSPWVVLAGAALVIGLVASFFVGTDYATRQTATRSFSIAEDFTTVRKILVRTDATKDIVTMGGGSEFVDKKWDDVGAKIDSLKLLDPEWKLNLKGKLKVRTKDDYIGEQVITLEQNVAIEPDFLHSQTKLIEPAERLRDYAMTTSFDRDDATNETKVHLELTQEILTRAPWFAHGIADRRVRESAERTLEHQETAIRKLLAENKDKAGLFPLR